jgi:hypothetical protein
LIVTRVLYAVALLLASAPAFAADGYSVYLNEKKGYEIAYPSSFVAQGSLKAGEDQSFISPQLDAELSISAGRCVEGRDATAADYIALHQQVKLNVTYKRAAKNFAVVSGTVGSRIFYHKLLIVDGKCAQFQFSYEREQSAKYDPVTAHIGASFKLDK